jgi:hypothetical protein
MPLRAVHLGRATDSVKTVLALVEAGIEPVVVNTEPDLFFESMPGMPPGTSVSIHRNLYGDFRFPRLKLARNLFAHSTLARLGGASLGRRLADVIDDRGPVDFVFANWGATVLPEVTLLQQTERGRSLPVILNLETFPTSWTTGFREKMETWMLAQAAPGLSGTIVPTREMAELIGDVSPTLSKRPMLSRPFYYPRPYAPPFAVTDVPRERKEGEVVFVGQFDLSRSLNDVRQQLRALAGAGLTVHCAQVDGISHADVRFFPPFDGEALSSGEVVSFLRKFQACVVTYALPGGGQVPSRFRTSLPSRFLIALAAGVPVLLPRGHFQAMEAFVRSHGIGHAYESPEDAHAVVTDPAWSRIERNAREREADFVFDRDDFLRFVQEVLSQGEDP